MRKKSNPWTQSSWERGYNESDEDYRERISELNAYRDFFMYND
jgi:hypothetical protein